MYDGSSVGVVIPAYNEEQFVGQVIDSLPTFVDRAYVVDDASTDGTWEEIQRRVEQPKARVPHTALTDGGAGNGGRLVPTRHKTNSGRGAAVKTGYRGALKDGMDVIAVMDADGQMDPAILDRFVEPVIHGDADYAKGNRVLSRGHRSAMSRWRLSGNLLLSYLTKVASGYWRTMDPQNGYTVISADILRAIDLDRLYDDYGFLNDLLVKLNVVDARVVDIAMTARYGEERSGIRYTSFVPKLSGLLLWDFFWRLGTKYLLFDFHPLVGFYALGGIGMIGGILFFGWNVATGLTPVTAALTFVLFLFSGLLLTLAMIYDRARNIQYESRIDEGMRVGIR